VASAGGWAPQGAAWMPAPGAGSFEKQGMQLMQKPFGQFKKRIEKAFEREEEEEDASEEEEGSFMELAVTRKDKKQIQAQVDYVTVWIKWLDLAANWHITMNTYIGLSKDYKAFGADIAAKTPSKYTTYLSFWTNSVKLHWQYSLIYADYLAIMNEYKPIQFLPWVNAYTLRSFDAFIMMWMWSSYVALWTSVTTPMTSAKAALKYCSAIQGIELSRVLKQIALIGYLDEFKVPAAKVFKGLVPFHLADFAIRIFWNSAISRAGLFLAK